MHVWRRQWMVLEAMYVVAEMGWEKASFNCTGVWDKDVILDKATAAVVADISKLVSSSSNSK